VSGDGRLAGEVYFLAYHLHWSRAEILGLPVPERHRYVELLREQLEHEARAAREADATR
jgi:hypothetical protein